MSFCRPPAQSLEPRARPGRVLKRFSGFSCDADVGQPILAAAAFQAASLNRERSLGFGVERAAASKGGCRQDCLPHVGESRKTRKHSARKSLSITRVRLAA